MLKIKIKDAEALQELSQTSKMGGFREIVPG